jgi:hypothetical protein
MPAMPPTTSPRFVERVEDLAGLQALDLVLVPGAACAIPAYLAERLLPPPGPAARTPAVPTATSR